MINQIQKIPAVKLTPKVYLELPESPGIYIFKNAGTPVYIGKANNLKRRVSSYFSIHLEAKTKKMMEDARTISFIKVGSELEALLLEAKLIKKYQPKYNIISKDDKHPLYIVISKEEFPRVLTVRKPDLNKIAGIKTYGPFPSSTNVKLVLKMLRRIFSYSDHKLGKKPCLYSQIKLCEPCPNEIKNNQNPTIKKVQLRKYKSNIRHLKAILDGKIENVKKELIKEMNDYSKKENYEEALLIRDKIKRLEYITNPKVSVDEYLENPNLYEDLKDKELKSLKQILKANSLNVARLKRIECFDVAHLQGTNTSASMVTFTEGTSDRNYYRHFKIYQKKGHDDYASMREVASRRKKHFIDWGRPDLIMVDGGKGQLSVFMKEFAAEGIPIIGLAKRFETLVIPIKSMGAWSFKEYRLPGGPALNLVQRIRNEAHRFAQAYHHKLFKLSLFEQKT